MCKKIAALLLSLLHLLFRLFPGFLTEKRVTAGDIKGAAQRALGFFFAGHTGPGGDHRHFRQAETLLSSLILRHVPTSFCFLVSMPGENSSIRYLYK